MLFETNTKLFSLYIPRSLLIVQPKFLFRWIVLMSALSTTSYILMSYLYEWDNLLEMLIRILCRFARLMPANQYN